MFTHNYYDFYLLIIPTFPYRFVAVLDGKTLVGKLMESEAALNVYSDAIASGNTAALASKSATNGTYLLSHR